MRRMICLSFLLLSGCVWHRPTAVSTSPISEYETPVMVNHGRACEYYILGFILWPFTKAGTYNAILDAQGATPADSVNNLIVDSKYSWFLLWSEYCTEITGTFIKYKEKDKDFFSIFDDYALSEKYKETRVKTNLNIFSNMEKGTKIRITTKNQTKQVCFEYVNSYEVVTSNCPNFFMRYINFNLNEIIKVELVKKQ